MNHICPELRTTTFLWTSSHDPSNDQKDPVCERNFSGTSDTGNGEGQHRTTSRDQDRNDDERIPGHKIRIWHHFAPRQKCENVYVH